MIEPTPPPPLPIAGLSVAEIGTLSVPPLISVHRLPFAAFQSLNEVVKSAKAGLAPAMLPPMKPVTSFGVSVERKTVLVQPEPAPWQPTMVLDAIKTVAFALAIGSAARAMATQTVRRQRFPCMMRPRPPFDDVWPNAGRGYSEYGKTMVANCETWRFEMMNCLDRRILPHHRAGLTGPIAIRSRVSGPRQSRARPKGRPERPSKGRPDQGDADARNHDRRQPAQARLAGRDQQTLARLEADRRRTRRGQTRRHAARRERTGRRRYRHRDGWRTGTSAFRARLPGAHRRHRLRPQGRNGHP